MPLKLVLREFSVIKHLWWFKNQKSLDKLGYVPNFLFRLFCSVSDDRKLYLTQISVFPFFIYELKIMKRDHRKTMWKHSNKLSPSLFSFQDLYLYLFTYGYMWQRERENPVDYMGTWVLLYNTILLSLLLFRFLFLLLFLRDWEKKSWLFG